MDDDPMLREGLVEQLSLYEEYETSQEATAVGGVEAAREKASDLVIMDTRLSGMVLRVGAGLF